MKYDILVPIGPSGMTATVRRAADKVFTDDAGVLKFYNDPPAGNGGRSKLVAAFAPGTGWVQCDLVVDKSDKAK